MAIIIKPFGQTKDGQQVNQYTLTNKSGASITVIEWGAILTSIIVPDREGNLADVALGFDNLEKYLGSHGSMGDTVGRYGNRIGKGKFTLDGVDYQLALNDHGINHLHGGNVGFASYLWEGKAIEGKHQDSVAFHRVSPDGEENYPGNLDVTVTYTWDDDNNLIIRYEATTDKATLCNLTNHTYFNLAGHDHGTVRDHVVFIDADVITPVDEGLIPTGAYMPVAYTPLDLRDGMLLGDGLDAIDTCPQMQPAGGYDHNFVLRKGHAMAMCACVEHEDSGRIMEVITDQPAIQLYTACTTNLEGGKGGVTYGQYSGFCLETQHCPDDPNNPQFPGTTVLRPGEKYDTTTIYAFRVDD
ncbi:MAG: galactose mutarotase [Clostridia bacterium]|nr:galactose mutarotase [Clostridia bacterium]